MLCSIYSAATILVSSRRSIDRHDSLEPILRLALALTAWCAVMWPAVSLAQNPNVQHTKNQMEQSLRGDFRVDPSTFGMSLSIPLASYPGRAGHGLPVVLNYSSKVFRLDFLGVDTLPISGSVTWTGAEFAKHSTAGWTSTLGAPGIEFSGMRQFYDGQGRSACPDVCLPGQPNPDYYIKRIHVHMPDGSSHELRLDDESHMIPMDPFTGTFYAVDSSRMRFESNAGSASVLYLPDGSRYFFPAYSGNDLIATQHVDRNGNTLSYDAANRRWTDTLGRLITNPLPESPAANTTTEFRAMLVGGTEAIYTFHWKNLGDVLTPTPSPTPQLHYPGSSTCSHNSYPTVLPRLFLSDTTTKVCVERDQNGNPMLFNPVVLEKIDLPISGLSYRFTYTVYGEIDKVYLPTGGTESFTYGGSPLLSPNTGPYSQTNRGVLQRRANANDGAADSVWTYEIRSSNPLVVRATAPNSTYSERLLHRSRYSGLGDSFARFGFDDARMGMVYEVRAFSSSIAMLRRSLSKWEEAGPTPGGSSYAARDPKVTKRVSILLDTGGSNALATTTEMIYDADLNVTSTKRYGFKSVDQTVAQNGDIASIPNGTLMRTEETDYLTGDANYRARNLLALPTATRIKDGSGNMVAQSAISYDESAFPLLTYSSVTAWTDPNTPARGNATTTSSWLNFNGSTFLTFPAGTYLLTHAQYDQCGSVRKVWDARDISLNNPTLVEYSSSYKFAYPTLNTSADPDGSGPLSALTTSTEYDLSTGLVTATTDANSQITSFAYNDPLNRIKQVIRAAGDAEVKNQTSYAYDDSGHTVTVTSDLNSSPDNLLKTVTVYDGLGRTTETRQYESGTSYIATQMQYDTSGRVFKTSNPFRPLAPDNETPVWITTAFDPLNRALTITTPDNAVVSTSYSGNRILITDQSGKQRLSESDALDRMTGVWEITPTDSATEGVSFPDHSEVTAGYRTSYGYDALDALVNVTQRIGTAGTTQTRTFVYDSLKRLTSAANPESGTISYQYDNNGNLTQKTDARTPAVTTTYVYDALNRVTNRNYSDDTPDVIYTYDASATDNFGKGRLTSVSSSVSSYSYLKYDALGRVLSGKQTTEGQDYTMSYGYNRAGNMKSQTYPSGRVVTSEFDPAGRLAGVVKNQTTADYYAGAAATDAANRVQYSAHGAIKDVKLGNGLWEHTIFNSRLQPSEIGLGTAQGGIDKLKLNYDYGSTDNNRNLHSQTITVPTVAGITGFTATQTYGYDSLNRLASAQESGTSWTQNFSYDRYGNRKFMSGTTLPATLTVANNPIINPNNNRIDVAASGQTSYSYDGAGNLTHDHNVAGHTFAYDGENKQKSYDGGASGGGGASYYFDGEGRRVKKVVGGSLSNTTVFIYNIAGQLVAEYTNVAPSGPGATSYLTHDSLGTPRVITGPNKEVRARHDYLPFGEELLAGQGARTEAQGYVGDNVRQKFTQKERDSETGLDYFISRSYSSTQGRFTSADSILGRRINPQSLNRYSYVINNPLRFIDPLGYQAQDPKLLPGEPAVIPDGEIIKIIVKEPKEKPKRAPGFLDTPIWSDGMMLCILGNCTGKTPREIIHNTGNSITQRIAATEQSVRKMIPDTAHVSITGFWMIQGQAGFTVDGDVFAGLETPNLAGWIDAIVDGAQSARTGSPIGLRSGFGASLTGTYIIDPATRASNGAIITGSDAAAVARKGFVNGDSWGGQGCYWLCFGGQGSNGRYGVNGGVGTPGVSLGPSYSKVIYHIPVEKLPSLNIPK